MDTATKDTGYYRVIEPDFGGYDPDSILGEFDTLKEARKCARNRIVREPRAYIEIVKLLSIHKGAKCRH